MKLDNPYLPKAYKLLDIRQETEIDYTFRVETDIKPTFGQFVQVSLPRIGEAPISVSDYGDGWIDLTIRKIGKVTDEIHALKAGDNIFLRGPYGNGFNLDKFKGKHIVIAAGGTGLAPVKSLINYFYNNSDDVEELELLLGFRDPYNIMFQEDIKKWQKKFHTTITVDNACGIDGTCEGLITEYVKHIKLSDFHTMEVIIVGPPIMMEFTAKEFLQLGVPEDKIWVSFERKMSCAIGKCGHCKVDEVYVCLEGPVFKYSQAKELID